MGYFEKILGMNLSDFGGGNFPIGPVLLCTFIGLIVATVAAQQASRVIFRAVKALMRHKALSPESAKTLKALGLSEDKALLFALRRPEGMLSRYLLKKQADEDAAKSEGEPPKAQSAAPSEAEYYLAPAMADKAKQILDGGEVSVLQTVLYCLLFAAIYFGIASLAPVVLPMIF